MVEQLVFYALSGILVFAGSMVVTVRNPIHAALFLVLSFFTTAGIWLLLDAEFLAMTLVLVYVGAVMVLFLFVIMMLDVNLVVLREGFSRYLPVGILIAVLLGLELSMVVGASQFGLDIVPAPAHHGAGYSNIEELGSVLYTVYVYPFEIASVLLLVAIVAAIALSLGEHRKNRKGQRPEEQVAVNRKDRVRLVQMAAERPDSDTP